MGNLEKTTPPDLDDLKDLFEAMTIGIIVIDRKQFKIKRYNTSAKNIFKNVELGDCILEISHELIYDDLTSDLKQIFKDFQPFRELMPTKGGNWYVIHVEPYKTLVDNEEWAVLSFADVTDLKVELEKKIEGEQQLQREILNVEEKERWRLGQFLHDNTAQILLAIKMKLDLVEPQFQQLDTETKRELKKVKRLVIRSEKQIRELSHFVLPIQAEGKISEAFQKLVEQTEELYNVKCTFKSKDAADEVGDAVSASSLYYISQEAIRNAIHHGKANKIDVTLSSGGNSLFLTVKDDGIGYDESRDKDKEERGMGINIMRHRAELLGGSLEVKESPEGGTIVKCNIPLERIKEKK